ncbi:MAG TPA: DUF5674 family protein [Candidatus Omnitrophota bacterium]|nr:DUF5674 family protein [Candidatus Omnitrophota bacterium]
MDIKIIRKKISFQELKELALLNYGHMIKGVVDLRQKIIALGGELHADAESVLLEAGSSQIDLWGFNIYPDKPRVERIEFTSLINIRPSQGNRSIEIKDEKLREKIRSIVDTLVE